jgi:hypothetical protein
MREVITNGEKFKMKNYESSLILPLSPLKTKTIGVVALIQVQLVFG